MVLLPDCEPSNYFSAVWLVLSLTPHPRNQATRRPAATRPTAMHSNCARLLERRHTPAGPPAVGCGALRVSVVPARRAARDPQNWRVNPRGPAIASQKPPTRHAAKANRNATQTDAIHLPCGRVVPAHLQRDLHQQIGLACIHSDALSHQLEKIARSVHTQSQRLSRA